MIDIEKLKNWLNLERKVLVHHMDVDGSCSSALFLKILDCECVTLKDPHLDQGSIKEIVSKNPELIVFLDLSIDQDLEGVLKLKKELPETHIAIIDHHVIHNDLNKHGMLHINPHFEDEDSYIPASLLSFQILEEFGFNMEPHMWISCLGTISDYGHIKNKEFMDRCWKMYAEYLEAKDIFESPFGKATKTIYSAIVYKGLYGTSYVIKTLKESENFEEFSKNPNLKKWQKAVDKEIEKLLKAFEKEKETHGKLLFFKLESKLGLSSIISNLTARKYPDKIIIIARESPDGWKISSRGPKTNVNLAEIMIKATKGIGRGGGHPQAAGAMVSDIEEFKKRLIKAIS